MREFNEFLSNHGRSVLNLVARSYDLLILKLINCILFEQMC